MSRIRFKLPVAVFMVLVDGKKVLSIRRVNTGVRDGMFSVPAGGLEEEEDVLSAAIREAKEEVGVTIERHDAVLGSAIHCNVDGENWINFFFFASKWSGVPSICEPDKHSDLSWFEADDLPANMVSYVALAINNWGKGVLYDDVGWREPAV